MSVPFPPGFLPRFPPRLPLHLMKSPEVQPVGQGGNQPKAGPLRAGTGYMSSDGTNVSIGVTLSGHRAASQEAFSYQELCLQVLSGQKAEETPEASCLPSKSP